MTAHALQSPPQRPPSSQRPSIDQRRWRSPNNTAPIAGNPRHRLNPRKPRLSPGDLARVQSQTAPQFRTDRSAPPSVILKSP